MLEARSAIPDESEAVDALIALGEFGAAHELVDTPEQTQSEGQRRRCRRRLQEAIDEAVASMRQRVFALRRRIDRLGWAQFQDAKALLGDAERLASVRWEDASAALELAERGVREEEWVRRDAILRRVNDTIAELPANDGERWRAAVEEQVRLQNWAVAAHWSREPRSDLSAHSLARRPPPWRYDRDPLRALAWIREAGDPDDRPRDFDRRWALGDADPIRDRLLDAVERVVTADWRSVDEADLRELLDALEEVLEVPAVVPPEDELRTIRREPVATVAGRAVALSGFLRGVVEPGLQAFSTQAYDRGTPFVVTKLIDSSLVEEAAKAELLDQATPSAEPEPAEETSSAAAADDVSAPRLRLCLGPEPIDRAENETLRVDPIELIRCVASAENRRLNAIRAFAGLVPAALGIPEDPGRPSAALTIGRDAVAEECLRASGPIAVVGPAGMGCRATVALVERLAHRAGRPVGRFRTLEELRALAALAHEPEALLVGSVGSSDVKHCLAEIDATGARAVVAVWIDDWWRLASQQGRIQAIVLRPLDAAAAQEVLLRTFDLLDVSFESVTAIDTLIYVAGGHPGVLHLAMRAVLRALGADPRRGPLLIEPAMVQGALDDPAFRQAAGDLLLAPLERRPVLRLVLGALVVHIEAERGDDHATTSDIVTWASTCGVTISSDQAEQALHRLGQCGLTEPIAGKWALARFGIGMLVRAAVRDAAARVASTPDAAWDAVSYMESAAQSCDRDAFGNLIAD